MGSDLVARFLSRLGDVIGPKNATAISEVLSTFKGFSSILAGVGAAALVAYFAGSFQVPYYVAGLFGLAAGTLAFVCLKPMVRRELS